MTDAASPPDNRTCPFCGVQIDAPANLCSKCGRFSSPEKTSRPSQRTVLQRIKLMLNDHQNTQVQIAAKIEERLSSMEVWLRRFPSWLPLTTALTFFGLAALIVAVGSWYDLRGAMGLIVLGCAILLRRRLVKPVAKQQPIGEEPDITLRWLGFDTNLILMQMLTLGATLVYAYRWETGTASIFAVCCISLAFLLIKTSYRMLTIFFGIVAAGYFACLWLFPFAFRSNDIGDFLDWYGSYFYNPLIPWGTLAIVLSCVALMPQLQLIRVGNFEVGNLRGDFTLRILGSTVPIFISSSVIFVSIIYIIERLFVILRFLIIQI